MLFYYSAFVFGSLILYYIYILELHLITKEYYNSKHKKWKKLNSLVATRHSNKYMITLISMQMVLQSFYIAFLQYMNTSVVPLGNGKFILSYIIRGYTYKMIVKPNFCLSPILQISDENSNDVTNIVVPYMGPSYDWHGIVYTPHILGYKTLTFELIDGRELEFFENNEISLDTNLPDIVK